MATKLILLGIAFSGASAGLFSVRLLQLQAFLKTHCPAIWEEHGKRLEETNLLTRYRRLTQIPFEYESDNEQVDRKLKSLVWIYRSSAVGLLILYAGLLIDLFSLVNS